MTANTFDSFSIICIETSVKKIYDFLINDKNSQSFHRVYEKFSVASLYSDIILQPHSYDAIFFESSNLKNRTIVIGNRMAWATLCNYISAALQVDNIQFHMNETMERNTLFYHQKGEIKRVVQAIRKEDNSWDFVSKGDLLFFENSLNYKKKSIKNRLNKSILIEYCIKNGLNILDENFFCTEQKTLYVRHLLK